MSWERILQNDRPAEPLRQRIDELFAQQRATWPALQDGESALAHLQRKTLTADGQSIVVQMNPARRRSTLAKTDAQAVAARACFLCPENMPAEERGIAFEDLVLMPNPYPILPVHCTIADRVHRPQRIRGRVDTFLHLAQVIGPDLAALYNGPRCGASAPDHFHLQAARADEMPLLHQLAALPDDRSAVAHTTFGRNIFVFRNTNVVDSVKHIERTIDALAQVESTTEEPMVNMVAHWRHGCYTLVLFPRSAHRPACYFATGADQLLVSPAVLEMSGILVATEPEHFSRIDAHIARTIYEEVSLPTAQFEQLAAIIEHETSPSN
ncbi:MAG TPA: DUF4922 domain-containing protein [Lacipirellulaceae bacterium]|nr:DUF4922 domain-containing protein [Lacipirellulaceae bacterium]